MIRLFTDTSANLPVELLREHNITIVPFSYTVNGEPADYSTIDGFSGKAFYDAMRQGAFVKTSMINIVTFVLAFEEALKNGDDVMYIGMSGGISGAANSAAIAVKELKESYPERKITSIDTYAASLGEGIQVLRAVELINQGVAFEDIEMIILEERETICQYFTVDDLEYLKRGGRISNVTAFVGSLLHIKPILTGDEQGRIVICGKARGRKQAIITLADKYDRLAKDKNATVAIAHADDEGAADELISELKKRGFSGKTIVECYEPVTGSHVGPGTLAFFFAGTHK